MTGQWEFGYDPVSIWTTQYGLVLSFFPLLDHCVVNSGKVAHYLKWNEFTDADNTWEPEENLDCPELSEAFLNSQKAGKEKDGTKRKSLSDSESDDSKSKKKRDAVSMCCPLDCILPKSKGDFSFNCFEFFSSSLFCSSS